MADAEPCRDCKKPFEQWPHFAMVLGRVMQIRVVICFDCYLKYLRACGSVPDAI